MMSDSVLAMLKNHRSSSLEEVENGLQQVLQELALLGLYRAKFFQKAAFYGGSALRLLYGLDRFSEDLDFSLLKKDPHFRLGIYKTHLENELRSHGFDVEFLDKEKSRESPIASAFIKANTLIHVIQINANLKTHRDALLKIKLEVDTDPPPGFATEDKIRMNPIPYSVKTMTLPSLFAGKVSALLCREYAHNVKGRDWYDFVWYVGRGVPLNLEHLEQRMLQTGHLKSKGLSRDQVADLIKHKAQTISIEKARADVERFVADRDSLSLWSPGFFAHCVDQMLFLDHER